MIIVAVMAGHDPEAQTLFDGGSQARGGYSPISSWIFASNWSSGGGFCR